MVSVSAIGGSQPSESSSKTNNTNNNQQKPSVFLEKDKNRDSSVTAEEILEGINTQDSSLKDKIVNWAKTFGTIMYDAKNEKSVADAKNKITQAMADFNLKVFGGNSSESVQQEADSVAEMPQAVEEQDNK